MLFSDHLSWRVPPGKGAIVLLLFAAASSAGAISHPRVFTKALQIQELSPQEADRAHPVRLHGVITYVDELTGDMFVQDDTAGIFIFVKQSHADKPLRAGLMITLTGITTGGEFSPCVTKASIQVGKQGHFPEPILSSLDVLLSGREDGHWAQVQGLIRSGEVKQGRLILNVSVGDGAIVGVTQDFGPDWAHELIDSEVVLRGAIAQLHNEHRQAVGVRLMIPPGFLKILKAAPTDPFSLPESSMASVRAYKGLGGPAHRVRVRGIAIGTERSAGLFLWGGAAGNLLVQGSAACVAEPGAQMDVAGFPGSIGTRPALLNSTCQTLSGKRTIEPIPLLPEQVLSEGSYADPSGYGFSDGTRHDMELVRLEGTLLLHSPGPEGTVLVLQAGNKQFLGIIHESSVDRSLNLENGSRLRLDGICLVTFDQYRRAESFRILVRNSHDVVVLKTAPWWNPRNAFRAVSVMALLLLIAVFWVARQTLGLRRANACLQYLSFQDGLTGVANRRKFDEVLEWEFRRAKHVATPISLIMVDIDYFKALNDRYGHQCGDECLVKVARALRSIPLRSSDLLARYGGEEFALILPGTDAEGAFAMAELIRTAVLDLAIKHEDSPDCRVVSISAGAATVQPSGRDSSASLIGLADRALYQSKAGGRNRTTYSATGS